MNSPKATCSNNMSEPAYMLFGKDRRLMLRCKVRAVSSCSTFRIYDSFGSRSHNSGAVLDPLAS